jgi:hypothetical protein
MFTHRTSLIWFRRMLVLGAVVAGATASAAGALPQLDSPGAATASFGAVVSRPPDVQDAVTALHSTPAGLKADGLRWQGIPQAYRILESAGNFPTQLGLQAEGMRLQGMAQVYQQIQPAADVVERFVAVHPDGLGFTSNAASVSRPPDISDTALAVQYGSATQSSAGFDWGDWAIGIGSGLGVALLLGACILMARQLRHGVQTA